MLLFAFRVLDRDPCQASGFSPLSASKVFRYEVFQKRHSDPFPAYHLRGHNNNYRNKLVAESSNPGFSHVECGDSSFNVAQTDPRSKPPVLLYFQMTKTDRVLLWPR
ncbi:hypothetical protein D8B26_003964 [Coccidioides posadasii str. Silveira]|uniref:Predicted protein n=1 Tax=Coccidioides posadasii (strain RMSCC 757 / Silveira) TaxID=443226 RepID=E9D9J9_COCPS|nr:predicted protein [Coccidioides posadasii str. Silveira]QVM09301.1 hypothetical protein D8B26_003964 [Coccidioides posadasii str. Silveira]